MWPDVSKGTVLFDNFESDVADERVFRGDLPRFVRAFRGDLPRFSIASHIILMYNLIRKDEIRHVSTV